MTHFLDETGNIAHEMPAEARELASFMALVVDETTKLLTTRLTPTDTRCFEQGCNGTTRVEIYSQSEEDPPLMSLRFEFVVFVWCRHNHNIGSFFPCTSLTLIPASWSFVFFR